MTNLRNVREDGDIAIKRHWSAVTRRKAVALVVIAGFAFVALLVAVNSRRSPDSPEALREGDLRLVSFNICGVVCAEGRDEAAQLIVDLVDTSSSMAVMLQEACRAQVEEIGRQLGAVWPRVEVHFVSSLRGDAGGLNLCPEDDFGVGLLTALPVLDRFDVLLPNPGLGATYLDERSLACLTAIAAEPVTICTTHVVRRTTDAAAHDAQVLALRDALPRLARERGRVIVTGDFNTEVDSLSGTGFVADELPGVDHILASQPAFGGIDAARHGCPCSDHKAVVATIAAAEQR